MPLAGNLRQASLLNILRTIALEQRDGCLTLTRGHLRAEIYFRRGQWLAAERVPVGPPLTEQFVAMGYMTPDQIEEVILVPFDEAAVLPDGQIVQALMADGLLTREQLQYWAMSDAIALVNAVLGWPDGDFSFVDGIHPPQELVLVSIPVENIVASLGPVDQSPAAQHYRPESRQHRPTPRHSADLRRYPGHGPDGGNLAGGVDGAGADRRRESARRDRGERSRWMRGCWWISPITCWAVACWRPPSPPSPYG